MPEEPLGARIAKRRHVLGFSQKQLAERVGVARDTVSMWERGNQFPHRHLGKLEHVLGVSLAEDADPEEAELLELLGRLQKMGYITPEEAAAKHREQQENKRRTRRAGAAERAG